jgi:hypothetical protein
MQGDLETSDPVGQVGDKVLYPFFVYCLWVEMSVRCRQMFPGKKKCSLDQLSPFGPPAVHPSVLLIRNALDMLTDMQGKTCVFLS